MERAGTRVRYLNIGDPVAFGFETPRHLVEVVERAMADGHNGYGPSVGIAPARQAVADEYTRRGWSVSADRVLITAGTSEGIELEILDLRTLLPLDDAAIVRTVKKTNKLLIVHEDTRTGGLAGEITARVNEQAFEWLDGPIMRVTAHDVPLPYAPTLEDFVLPQTDDIVKAARWLAKY